MSRGSERRPQPGASVVLLVIAGVLLAGGSAVVWVISAVAGVLAGSDPVMLGFSEAAGVLARLPRHLDHPPAAWPTHVRSQLDPTALLVSLLAVAALLVILCAVALRLARRLTRGGVAAGGGRGRGARWAGPGDLRALRVRAPRAGRVTLGRHRGRLIAAEARQSVLVVAPMQSGKTTGLAIPALLEWEGPVLATSVKGDLVHDTLAARARRGQVRVFDPTGSTGLPTGAWSPVAASASWEGARRIAARLLQVGERGGSSADESFWRPAAARYLAPLLLAAAQQQRPMRDVLSWIATSEMNEPRDALMACDVAGAEPALDALESVWEADERFRSSVLQTAATALDAWQEPRIASATGAAGAIDADWLLAGPHTLYLSAPAHDQRRLRGLFAALIADVVAAAFTRSQVTGRPIDPPLLLALDEAANVAPLPNLDEIASTGPGQGVQLLTVVQNLSQLADRWGRERADTILANHRARLFGSGIADRATVDYLGAVLGEEEIKRTSTHRQRLELRELGSRTDSHEFRRLAPPHRVRQAPPGSALLVYGHLPPAWITLRPWYRDRTMRRQVQTPIQPSPPAQPPAAEPEPPMPPRPAGDAADADDAVDAAELEEAS